MIVVCPGCKTQHEIPETWAGKTGRCASCGTVLDLPNTTTPGAVEEKTVVICLHCGQRVAVPRSWLGKRGRCKSCQQLMTLTEAAPLQPADSENASPGKVREESVTSPPVTEPPAGAQQITPAPVPESPAVRKEVTPPLVPKSMAARRESTPPLAPELPAAQPHAALLPLPESTDSIRQTPVRQNADTPWEDDEGWVTMGSAAWAVGHGQATARSLAAKTAASRAETADSPGASIAVFGSSDRGASADEAPETPRQVEEREPWSDDTNAAPSAPRYWCGVGDGLEPELALAVHLHDSSRATPVQIDLSDRSVTLSLAAIPVSWLASDLAGSLLLLAVVIPLKMMIAGMVISACVFFAVISMFTLNILGFFGTLTAAASNGFAVLQMLVEWSVVAYGVLQRIIAIVKKEPFVFRPSGMQAENDVVAVYSQGDRLQVLRLDVSTLLLKQKSTKGEGCLKGLVSILMLPIMFALNLTSSQKESQAALFVFVTGSPLGSEAGGEGRLVHLVSVPCKEADDLQSNFESALGLSIQVVDEKAATTQLWTKA